MIFSDRIANKMIHNAIQSLYGTQLLMVVAPYLDTSMSSIRTLIYPLVIIQL